MHSVDALNSTLAAQSAPVTGRQDVLGRLKSAKPHERLRAARELSKSAVKQDRLALEEALAAESVTWIRAALDAAIQRCGGITKRLHEDVAELVATDEDALAEEVRAQAIEETTGRFVHEMRKIVGQTVLSATDEVESYEGSRTHYNLQRIRRLLKAIEILGQAAGAPQIQDFNLPELIVTITSEVEENTPDLRIDRVGPDPLLVSGDRSLLEVAFQNGLYNAIEASSELGRPVLVTWGETDRDYWIAVLDQGHGLPPHSDQAFEIGVTTKSGEHLGMGLALARRAVRSMGGEIALSPRQGAGASYELRWPRSSEDANR